MPPPRGTRAEQHTRQIVGVLTDTTNSAPTTKVDGTNEHHISMMIQDLENGFKKQLAAIETDMLTCKQEQLEAHNRGMMKIPKGIKEMTIKEFNQKYGCNLIELLQTAKSNALRTTSADAAMGATMKMQAPMCGKRDRVFETPAPNRGNRPMQTPGGTMRTVRRGEKLYSLNGSPVDPVDQGVLVATVTKKHRGNAPPAANFDINVGDGRYISLNDPSGVKNLDASMKSNAVQQLKVLQDQMASLMAQLTTKAHK